MRVTMLVRCLAMMRGGGETRHLAWARELTALGVDVESITGRPLVGGAAVCGHGWPAQRCSGRRTRATSSIAFSSAAASGV